MVTSESDGIMLDLGQTEFVRILYILITSHTVKYQSGIQFLVTHSM